METKKKFSWVDLITIILLIAFFVFIIYYVIVTTNKSKEIEELRKRYNNLKERKSFIEDLKLNLDGYFKIAYNIVKSIICLIFIAICFIIYYYLPNPGFWSFISAFTDLFGALSLLILFICLILEENPINIFYLRDKLKTIIKDLIYGDNKAIINEIPAIEKEIQITKEKIDSLNRDANS